MRPRFGRGVRLLVGCSAAEVARRACGVCVGCVCGGGGGDGKLAGEKYVVVVVVVVVVARRVLWGWRKLLDGSSCRSKKA